MSAVAEAMADAKNQALKITGVTDSNLPNPPYIKGGAGPDGKNIGRNDPCWCGAKKPDGTSVKYKNCHGK